MLASWWLQEPESQLTITINVWERVLVSWCRNMLIGIRANTEPPRLHIYLIKVAGNADMLLTIIPFGCWLLSNNDIRATMLMKLSLPTKCKQKFLLKNWKRKKFVHTSFPSSGMRWPWRGRSVLCVTSTVPHTSFLPSWSSCLPSCRTLSVKASSFVVFSPQPPTAWCWEWRWLASCRDPSRCGTTHWHWWRK